MTSVQNDVNHPALLQPSSEDQYPCVQAAYDFVLPSYQMLLGRVEAADNRLAALATWVASVTLAVPLFAKGIRSDIAFTSPLFAVAMVFALCAAVFSIAGRVRGHVILPNPGVLFKTALHESLWTFKKNSVFFAGQHFVANAATIQQKAQIAIWATIALFLEILSLVTWVAW